MRKAHVAAGLAAALLAGGCGASSGSTNGASGRPSTSATGASAPSTASTASTGAVDGCRRVRTPAPKGPQHLGAPSLRLDPARTYTVHVDTNCGAFAFTLDVKQSPRTSASFYYLVKHGFYSGLIFHRVVPGFVIQGGDPLGNGTGGPGYTVVEAPPKDTQYVRGDVAMAKTQTQPAGASGSQFFIVTGSNVSQSAGLTPDYALAGRIVSGIAVVERIGSLPTDGAEMPSPPVVMTRVTVSVS